MMRFVCSLAVAILLSSVVVAQTNSADTILRYGMTTPWTDKVDPNNVWNVYPRPQLKRANWTNLNGQWDYAIQAVAASKPAKYQGSILVPFAVESTLSGVKKTVGDENYLWYRKQINVPTAKTNERYILHFGAVDWEAFVYINGQEAAIHKGGYTGFDVDITPFLSKKGKQEIVVRVWDPTNKETQARGKQVAKPGGIWYTPVTGIWQTVWLEKVHTYHIQAVKITPLYDDQKVRLEVQTTALPQGTQMKAQVLASGKETGSASKKAGAMQKLHVLEIPMPDARKWTPTDPFLYDIKLELRSAQGVLFDEADSYMGMRKIALGKDPNGYTSILLNDEPLYQFGLLDQGWWPDGLYTAPTFEAMLFDVEKTQEWGFNMLRKHVKVEPASFYHACDKMGVLVWQDMPSGYVGRSMHVAPEAKKDITRSWDSALQFEAEWKELIDQFYHFPSIIMWVPFNEGWGQYDTERITAWTKNYDPSRIINSPSGWTDRGVGDVFDVHQYPGPAMEHPEKVRASVLGEFGGLGYPVKDHLWWNKRNWGYLTYQSQDTFRMEFNKLMESLWSLKSMGLCAAVYTQTTDVEGEVNGLMTYDRKVVKIDAAETRKMLQPLYAPVWNRQFYFEDSENIRQLWKTGKVSTNNTENWMKPGFDDSAWSAQEAPFSSYANPYLTVPHVAIPVDSTLYLRKSFMADRVPERLVMRFISTNARAKVYINGVLVKDMTDRGGNRHYSQIALDNPASYMKKGKNLIAVEVIPHNKNFSFDAGLYTYGFVED